MLKKDLLHSILGKDFEPLSLPTQSFSVHGLSLNVASNSSFILDAIQELLHYFRCPRKRRKSEVNFYLLESPLTAFRSLETIRRKGELLYDSKRDDELGLSKEMEIRLRYFAWDAFFIADFGSRGIFLLDPSDGAGVGLFPDPAFFHPGIFSNFVFLVGLSEILRSKELFLIHGGALEKRGKGILIPGFTGSGKTTLTLALLRQGFRFLSDDRPFLRENGEGFDLLAFPEEIDVTEKTRSFFPELRSLPEHLFKWGPQKKRFWVETVYPNSVLDRCLPKVLLFPKIAERERSRLEPLSRIEAIGRLLPHTLLVFESTIARKQFHFLCRLIETMDCYCLHFGRDILQVHRVVEEIIG